MYKHNNNVMNRVPMMIVVDVVVEEVVRDVEEVTLVVEVDDHLRGVEVVDDSREGE